MLRTVAIAGLLAFVGPAIAQEVAFERETLVVPTDAGPLTLDVEIADTRARRSRGLMERTDIAEDEGMLFVFAPPREITMWMRNTPTSLDMIFIDPAGEVTHIAPDTVPFSTETVSSRGPAAFVLEVVAGSAERWGLESGDRLESERFER